jgi:hypothetical protein
MAKESAIEGKVSKVYGIDCGHYEVVNSSGETLKSPFLIGANGLDVVFYTEEKEEFGTSINCKLYSVCTEWDEEKEEDVTKKDELIAWNDLYIPEVESTVNEDWFDL